MIYIKLDQTSVSWIKLIADISAPNQTFITWIDVDNFLKKYYTAYIKFKIEASIVNIIFETDEQKTEFILRYL